MKKNVRRYTVGRGEGKIENGFNPEAFVFVIGIRRLTLKRLALVRKTPDTSAR